MSKRNILFLFLFVFFIVGCASKHFVIYSMDGKKIAYDPRKKIIYPSGEFKLYFDRDNIKEEYTEINILSTDNFYYGQFFFDEVFMDILKKKSYMLGANALIYERSRKDYPDYDSTFLYFTAIKYK